MSPKRFPTGAAAGRPNATAFLKAVISLAPLMIGSSICGYRSNNLCVHLLHAAFSAFRSADTNQATSAMRSVSSFSSIRSSHGVLSMSSVTSSP